MSDFTLPPSPAPWFLFDNSAGFTREGSALPQAQLLENPVGIVRADTPCEVPTALAQLQRAIDNGLTAAGLFSYELGYVLEPSLFALLPPNRQVPLIWFALFEKAELLNAKTLTDFIGRKSSKMAQGSLKNLTPSLNRRQYLQRFVKVKQLIASGDIYQVNLAFKLKFETQGPAFSLYASLRRRQPVSYGAYLQCPEFSILSFSPELFFAIENGEITTRPMKGTIRRGDTPKEDRWLGQELQGDVKNRAENLMIVDLMRNDFSRICEVGSIEVSDLYRIDRYPTLAQMTSGVRGRLRPVQLADIIKALMPAGSITGAPKIRAQEIISKLEDDPRGLYCGALGMLSRNQQSGQLSALFNVSIRTLTLFPDGRGETGIGSGIVQDSNGAEEYDECLLKAKFLTMPDIQLIETMRLELGDPNREGCYVLLELHMQRLSRSSRELGFFCPVDGIRQALKRLAKRLAKTPGANCFLVRLLLSAGGQFTVTSTSIAAPDPHQTIGFVLSEQRIDSANGLLAHKTTQRQLFDEEWARANEEQGANEERGANEVLFLNERSELCEGARSNLFIERDGKLLTPPLHCGLLPGTLRAQLIEQGRAVERVLRLNDLDAAKIYFGNSVRGLQPARLLPR